MRRLSFQEAAARFGHIDGLISDVRLRYPESVEVDVRFYPWWEHPLYQAAVRRGVRWGFRDCDELARICTLVARGLEVVHVSGTSAVDIILTENHPILWCQDTDRRSILVNSDVDRAELTRAVEGRMRQQNSPGSVLDILAFLSAPTALVRAPCSMGQFPRQVYDLVLGALLDLGVQVFREEPRWLVRDRRLLVELDDTYLIASDIYIDVPEFLHPPEIYSGE